MIMMTHESRAELEKNMKARQRWQRALAHWSGLGFFTKVYSMAAHLQDQGREAKQPLDGQTAYRLALLAIEREVKDGQQSLAL